LNVDEKKQLSETSSGIVIALTESQTFENRQVSKTLWGGGEEKGEPLANLECI
jgi:hypothetical protein